ncbi:hypothetical protein SK128_007275, partial [Halocaridina rubra]
SGLQGIGFNSCSSSFPIFPLVLPSISDSHTVSKAEPKLRDGGHFRGVKTTSGFSLSFFAILSAELLGTDSILRVL